MAFCVLHVIRYRLKRIACVYVDIIITMTTNNVHLLDSYLENFAEFHIVMLIIQYTFY